MRAARHRPYHYPHCFPPSPRHFGVCSILRRHELFERLAELTVEGWTREQSAKTAKRAALAAAGMPSTGAAAAAAGTGLGHAVNPHPRSPAEEGGEAGADDSAWVKRNVQGGGAGSTASAAAAAVAASNGVGGASASRSRAGTASSTASATPPEWVPTEEWLEGVKRGLPLATLLRLISYLSPLVQAYVKMNDGSVEDDGVVAFIKSTTVVGILPVPHPILMRKYQPNQYTALWFTTFLWSTVFLHLSRDLPMFDADAIRLFTITVV
jgi:hypothetical protein